MEFSNIKKLIQNIMEDNKAELEQEDIANILSSEVISKDINKLHLMSYDFGDKIADNFANFAGSWKFIIGFVTIITIWIIFNRIVSQAFDPFPFILLNLILSCVAALQAPVIMMSQNRQEEKDRLQAKNEYRLNVKSELLIEELNKKINVLLDKQNSLKDDVSKLQSIIEESNRNRN